MKDYEILKKKYGEEFAKFCRSNFSTILEEEGKLSEIILSKFAPNKFLYSDLTWQEIEENFVNYVYSFYDKNEIKVNSEETPDKLLDKAGYNLYKCETNEDVLKFKKYYKADEELCTFRDAERINKNIIFFAVKKNVDEIKRENFTSPERQDEYGTSVMSIQFSKNGFGTVSIKNRYNHTVENPDATFSNNLDNIIEGLSDSFEKHYNLKIQNKYGFDLKHYVYAPDGKYYPYNVRIANNYFCKNNVIVSGNKVKQLNKDRYEVFDMYILDKKERKIFSLYNDGFVKSLRNIEKIEVVKNKSGSKNIYITDKKNGLTKIVADEGALIEYENNNIKCLENYFFSCANLEKFSAENLIEIKNNCLQYTSNLKEISLPKVEKIGNDFAFQNKIENFTAPCLKTIGDRGFALSFDIKTWNTPKLTTMGKRCLNLIGSGKIKIEAENLKSIDENCFGFSTEKITYQCSNRYIMNYIDKFDFDENFSYVEMNLKENPILFNQAFK